MRLSWEERYAEFEAVTEHGTYSIDSPDSLGRRQVDFWLGPQRNFVAVKVGEEEAKEAAQKHFDWLLHISKRRHPMPIPDLRDGEFICPLCFLRRRFGPQPVVNF